jgi:type II secretory pathway pseudopilin PulG
MKRSRKSGGFALAELLIGMVILVILLSAISTFLVPGVSSTKYAMSQENSLSKARFALNRIVDVIRYNPRTVTSPTSAGTTVNQLVFRDEDSNVYDIAVTTGDSGKKSVTIKKNSTIIETFAEGIAENITFALDSDNPNQVKIELTLNDKSYSASPEVKVTTLVKMENI